MARRKIPQRARTQPETEAEFLKRYDPAAFEHPSVAVDVALLTVRGDRLCTLLVQRAEHPHRGRFGLPGGFVGMRESLDAAARRVLATKVGLRRLFTEQLYTFGDPQRDPRTRVISVTYIALADPERFAETPALREGVCVAELSVPWEGETGGPVTALGGSGEELSLAFDHDDILGMAVKRVRGKLGYTPIGFQLLAETFTLLELQTVHEAVLGRALNKDSFRRKILASGQLEATGERQADVGHRPAELYRFVRRSAV